MKKTISLLLILACLLSLCACGGEKAINDTSIEQTLLYQENDITVSATGITHVEDAYILHLQVDNRYKEGITLDFNSLTANGLYLPFESQAYRNGNACQQIYSNSKATVELRIHSREFTMAGMDALTQLDFAMGIHAVSSDTDLAATAVSLSVHSDNALTAADFGGEVIFSANDILVSYKLVDNIPYFFIANNYRRAVSLYITDFSINGYYYDYVGLQADLVQPGFYSVETFSNLDTLMMPPGDTAQVQFTVIVSDLDGYYHMESSPVSYECPMYETSRRITQQPQILYSNEQITLWADRFYDDGLQSESVYIRAENNSDTDVILYINSCAVNAVSTDHYTRSLIAPAGYHNVGTLFRRFTPGEEISELTLNVTLSAGTETLLDNEELTLSFGE